MLSDHLIPTPEVVAHNFVKQCIGIDQADHDQKKCIRNIVDYVGKHLLEKSSEEIELDVHSHNGIAYETLGFYFRLLYTQNNKTKKINQTNAPLSTIEEDGKEKEKGKGKGKEKKKRSDSKIEMTDTVVADEDKARKPERQLTQEQLQIENWKNQFKEFNSKQWMAFTKSVSAKLNYGILADLPRCPIDPNQDDDKRKTISFDMNVNLYIKKLLSHSPDMTQSFVQGMASGYVTLLTSMIREMKAEIQSLKKQLLKQNKEQRYQTRIRIKEIEQYVQAHKYIFNDVLRALKINNRDYAIASLCEDSDHAFARYLRSLVRAFFGLGGGDDTALHRMRRQKMLTYFGITEAQLADYLYEDNPNKVRGNNLDENDNLNPNRLNPIDLMKALDQCMKIDENAEENKKNFQAELRTLLESVENEYIAYYTKNEKGEYGLFNPALYFDLDQPSQVEKRKSENNRGRSKSTETAPVISGIAARLGTYDPTLIRENKSFAQERALRQLNNSYQPIVERVKDSLSYVFPPTFSSFLFRTPSKATPGSITHAHNVKKALQTTLRNEDQSFFARGVAFFEECYQQFYISNLLPKGESRNALIQYLKKDFIHPLHRHYRAVRFIDSISASENENLYQMRWKCLHSSMLQQACVEMDSNLMSVCKLFPNIAINVAQTEKQIKELFDELNRGKQASDYLKVLEELAILSRSLSKVDTWNPICKLLARGYKKMIEAIAYTIVDTHFAQPIARSHYRGQTLSMPTYTLPVTYSELQKASYLLDFTVVNSYPELRTIKIKLHQKMKEVAKETHDDSKLLLLTENKLATPILREARQNDNVGDRITRFEEKLLHDLTASTIADLAISSGKISQKLKMRNRVIVTGAAGAGALVASAAGGIPGAAIAAAGATAGLRYAETMQTKNASKQRGGRIMEWLDLINRFTPFLSALFRRQISQMVGNDDIETFAALCQERIEKAISNPNMPFPWAADNKSKFFYLLQAIFCREDSLSAMPFEDDCYYVKAKDGTIKKKSFQKMFNKLWFEVGSDKTYAYNLDEKIISPSPLNCFSSKQAHVPKQKLHKLKYGCLFENSYANEVASLAKESGRAYAAKLR